jgi:hypothetical protein
VTCDVRRVTCVTCEILVFIMTYMVYVFHLLRLSCFCVDHWCVFVHRIVQLAFHFRCCACNTFFLPLFHAQLARLSNLRMVNDGT